MLLQCKNLHKSFGTDEILRDVSFILEEREKAALVGVNGAGKTSVFRLLNGEWPPDGGSLILSSGTRVGYLPQLNDMPEAGAENAADEENTQPSYHNQINRISVGEEPAGGASLSDAPAALTLYDELDSVFDPLKRMENEIHQLEKEMGALTEPALSQAMERYARLSQRFEEQGGYEQSSRVRGVLKGLGFLESEFNQPLYQLSGGQRTRAALGKLLLTQPDLLLLDEPTNHLDIESVSWLEDYLRAYNGALIIISHDRYFMDRVVTKTIEVEHKKTAVYNGNYTFYAHHKSEGREVALRQYWQQQKEIKRQQEVIKTLRSFKTEAAIIRAKSREKLLDKMERVEKPDSLPDKMRLMLTPKITSGNDVLAVENMRMGFNGKLLFDNVGFELKRGDRKAVVGPNGIGKTTLFKIIMGEFPPLAGKIKEGVNVRFGYYDQAQQRLSEDKTVFQELADTYPRLTQTEIRNILAAFVFTGDDVFKPVSALSGGERGRVSLAKIMLGGANLLVLDEPTNHLDMYSKEILEEALRDFPGTLLYISHDRYFINNTATSVLELSPGGITEYAGNYDYYIEKKKSGFADREAGNAITIRAARSEKDGRQRKKEMEANARRLKSRIEKLESEIAGTEADLAGIEEKLTQDEYAFDAEAAAALYAEKTVLDEKLLALYEDWEALAGHEANEAAEEGGPA